MPKTADFCAKASLRRAQGAENSTFALSLPLVALPASSCSKWARVMAQTACTVGFSRRARWDVHAIRHTPIVRTFCRARWGAHLLRLRMDARWSYVERSHLLRLRMHGRMPLTKQHFQPLCICQTQARIAAVYCFGLQEFCNKGVLLCLILSSCARTFPPLKKP